MNVENDCVLARVDGTGWQKESAGCSFVRSRVAACVEVFEGSRCFFDVSVYHLSLYLWMSAGSETSEVVSTKLEITQMPAILLLAKQRSHAAVSLLMPAHVQTAHIASA